MDIKQRFSAVAILAESYENFVDFAVDGMAFLGFDTTEMQADIAEFMQHGPRLRMVMAQRGEAKTTLAALYSIWRIIHRPSTRVLIISAGADNSSDTATLIVRLIMTWDILECLRPDRSAGDRVSTEAFDVHYALKGLDRSPSIACAGITSNLPGRRADLLIPDDIESNKNGLSATERLKLMQSSKEFSSICTHGDILYLGTPQSKDSVYNTLPGRGFAIRIWPGRFPALYVNDKGEEVDEAEKYGDRLAPFVRERMLANPMLRSGFGIDGSKGAAADPGRYTDADLIEKELDKGPEDFQLQYMLDTSLVDAMRQQLKLSDLVVANFSPERVPEIISWQAAKAHEVQLGGDFPVPMARMYYAPSTDCEFATPSEVVCAVDPAGGGTDEIGFACGFTLGPYIHVKDVVGLKGGIGPKENERAMVEFMVRNKVTRLVVESNMGHGAFETVLRGIFAKYSETAHLQHMVQGKYSTGQKEKRIIGAMVSAMQRHRVVVHQQVFDSDAIGLKQHGSETRNMYSLWYQIANITTDRQSLPHDDRIEAMSMLVAEFLYVLDQDEHKAAEQRAKDVVEEWLRNPMGYDNVVAQYAQGGTRDRFSRRR